MQVKKLIVPVICVILLSGCKLKKEVEVSLPVQTDSSTEEEVLYGDVLDIETGEIDVLDLLAGVELDMEQVTEEITSLAAEVWNISVDELENYYLSDWYYEKGSSYINADPILFEMGDWKYGLTNCYGVHLPGNTYLDNPLGMRQLLPFEEIDTCSKEEVLEICAAYAQILGYGDGEAEVYALTLDYLESTAQLDSSAIYAGAPDESYEGAPDESYEGVSLKQIEEERTKGNEDLANEWEIERKSIYQREIPWEKKHEALYVVYRPYIHGKLMYSRNQALKMIYVPYYQQIIYVEGRKPYCEVGILRQEELISREQAVSAAMIARNMNENSNFKVRDISLVYTQGYEVTGDTRKTIAVPSWKIDYSSGAGEETQATIFINAVNGFECYTENY